MADMVQGVCSSGDYAILSAVVVVVRGSSAHAEMLRRMPGDEIEIVDVEDAEDVLGEHFEDPPPFVPTLHILFRLRGAELGFCIPSEEQAMQLLALSRVFYALIGRDEEEMRLSGFIGIGSRTEID